MAGIFTRTELAKILNNGDLTPDERADQIFSLYGRALDDGYVTKKAAEAAQKAAIETAQEAWKKDQPTINVLEAAERKLDVEGLINECLEGLDYIWIE